MRIRRTSSRTAPTRTGRDSRFESYLQAPAIAVLGPSRAALPLAPLLAGVVTLVAFWLLVRSLLGPPLGAVALLFMALASPVYVFWTYLPIGYAETMLFGSAVLCFAERIRSREDTGLAPLGLGLAGGLGFWNSILTLAFLLPALAWLPWRRQRLATSRRFLALLTLGFVVGAAPWIAYNVVYPLASFRNNFATRPSSRPRQLLSNAGYLATYSLPELVAATDPEDGINVPSRVQVVLRPAVLALHVAAGLFVLVALARWWRPRSSPAPGWVLLLLVAAVNILFAVISEAGDTRGLTARYILPIYLIVPAALALLLSAVWKRSRVVAAVLGALCLVFNVAGYWLPGTPMRLRCEERAREDDRLVRFLAEHDVGAVFGDYWTVYPINFLTRERILGIARQPEFDFFRYGDLLIPGRRWALVSRESSTLELWARKAGIDGLTSSVGTYDVFVPNDAFMLQSPRAFVERLRSAYPVAPAR